MPLSGTVETPTDSRHAGPAPTNLTCFMHHETMTPATLSACTGVTRFRCNWLMVGLGMGRISAECTPRDLQRRQVAKSLRLPLTVLRPFDILQSGPKLSGERMPFTQLKRREGRLAPGDGNIAQWYSGSLKLSITSRPNENRATPGIALALII